MRVLEVNRSPSKRSSALTSRSGLTGCFTQRFLRCCCGLIFLVLLNSAAFAASAQSRPSITASDASVLEGNSGTTNLIFHLLLSNPSKETVMVDYATRDVTATSGVDYSPAFG